MANTNQARKRARQADKHRKHNAGLRSQVRTYIKNTRKQIAAGDVEGAERAYNKAVPVIDGMVGKGIIHKNQAARHKSRLNARIHELKG